MLEGYGRDARIRQHLHHPLVEEREDGFHCRDVVHAFLCLLEPGRGGRGEGREGGGEGGREGGRGGGGKGGREGGRGKGREGEGKGEGREGEGREGEGREEAHELICMATRTW